MIIIQSDYTERKMRLLVTHVTLDEWFLKPIAITETVDVVVTNGIAGRAQHYGLPLPEITMDEIDEAVGIKLSYFVIVENEKYDPYLPENIQTEERYVSKQVR